MKRFVDTVLSGSVLLLFSPVLFFIALAVWIDAGRPILFAQERVGKHFRRFRLWKFRSMRVSSEGPAITVAGDLRITRIGRVLRKTKLDELPQLWNVFRGEMSLVGPRPEVPQYVDMFRQEFEIVLSVRPGITDVSTLHFHNEEALLAATKDPVEAYTQWILPEKLRLAQEYVRYRTLASDFRVLTRTLALVAGRLTHVEVGSSVKSDT